MQTKKPVGAAERFIGAPGGFPSGSISPDGARPQTRVNLAKYRLPILGLLIIGSLLTAWHNRFIQDDAFISFVYAQSLVEGTGLTWFGTHVEGYTNFLWVLWIALGLKAGFEPIMWTYVGGMISFAAAIYGIWRLSCFIFKACIPAVFIVLMFVSNYSVSAYATGGLATMLQTALLCLSVLCLYQIRENKEIRSQTPVILSILLAAAILTRIDNGLPAAIITIFALLHFYRSRVRWKHYACLIIPLALIVGGWLLWKLSYYGRILPNTYYAKIGSGIGFNKNGFVYLARFFDWYLIWPFITIGFLSLLLNRQMPERRLRPILVILLAWCAYIVWVGGDFMEFRFMVPVIPFLFIFIGYLVYYVVGKGKTVRAVVCSAVCLAVLLTASLRHARTFKFVTDDRCLDSIPALATFYGTYPDEDWGKVGRKLGDQLADTDAVLAVTGAGAIPFYSGLKSIDMWGLNDLNIPRIGNKPDKSYRRPGHQRHASEEYLRQQKVNLIIGYPTIIYRHLLNRVEATAILEEWIGKVIEVSEEPQTRHGHPKNALKDSGNNRPIGRETVVAMPLDERGTLWDPQPTALLMWYLTQSDDIDKVIAENNWETRTLDVGHRDPKRKKMPLVTP